MPDITVFCASEDKERVKKLVNILKKSWDVWWYYENSVAGNWNENVEKAIANSKCVIPIWTSTSTKPGKKVVNETKRAVDEDKDVVPIKFDEVVLPTDFNYLDTIDLIGWNGEKESLEELSIKLKSIIDSSSLYIGRPFTWDFGGSQLPLPCFVRSVSSYETQLSPHEALKAMELLGFTEPLLVSSYDITLPNNPTKEEVINNKKILKSLNNLKENGCFIFMDSGKYEASRKGELELNSTEREAGLSERVKKANLWTEKKFNKTLEYDFYDYVFCFDNIYPPKSVKKIVNDSIVRITNPKSNKLIPIVHAPLIKSSKKRNTKILVNAIYELAKVAKPPIIATPERELGDGIIERARTVADIRNSLNNLGFYQPIHILGTGNPISIAILSAAGADLFDGLEWCRTTADRENATLHHHQHIDFFINQTIDNSFSTIVKEMLNTKGAGMNFKLAGHNLDYMSEWMDELQSELKSGVIVDMLNNYLPTGAIKKLRNNVEEIFK